MRLHEYQSKEHLKEYGIPVALGKLATSADEAYEIAKELSSPVVIKAQVLTSGRQKSHGIEYAWTPEDTRAKSARILSTSILGLPVNKVLIDPRIDIIQQLYLGITYDRSIGRPVLVASSEGGIDIEQVAIDRPKAIIREEINPILGLRAYQITAIASHIELPRSYWKQFTEITQTLYDIYAQSDALLAEINPLAITKEDTLIALDAKLVIDENALYRQQQLNTLKQHNHQYTAETEANNAGFSYIKLSGQIGCMVNGAGLAMTTMDMTTLYGGEHIGPANFLDIGGGARSDKVALGLRLILSDPDVQCILLNIFGGITRCDEVARGIISAYEQIQPNLPIILRLQGTNAQEGLRIINDANISNMHTAKTLTQAAKRAVDSVRDMQS